MVVVVAVPDLADSYGELRYELVDGRLGVACDTDEFMECTE